MPRQQGGVHFQPAQKGAFSTGLDKRRAWSRFDLTHDDRDTVVTSVSVSI